MASFLKTLFALVVILVALAGGFILGQKNPMPMPAPNKAEAPANDGKGKILYYRNPMGLADTSPVPKQDSMGMDYVPVYENDVKDEAGTVRLSPERIQKLGVRTETATRRTLAQPVHAVGTVQIDETRQTVVAPRFEGWIVKLAVDATGRHVQKGDPLFDLYSKQLAEIEAEYLVASDTKSPAKNGSLERLKTLAVPEEEIARLQREKTVNNTITMRAPADGTVVEKRALEGMKFDAGDLLYRLTDLSSVWVIADVFEQDLSRVQLGQTANITINAYPDRLFEGKVSFIYPDINAATRTAKVRIDLPNPTGDLRTSMYVTADLKAAEPPAAVLTVADSAVLNSGTRQIVLVDLGEGRYAPRDVKTGTRADGFLEIREGLNEGDRVVTSANFLIDAESNLRAALQAFTAPEAGAKP